MQFAREKGCNVWSTWYPWDAGSGNVGADIVQPGIWEEKMVYKTEETIYDPAGDRFLTRDEVVKLGKENPGCPSSPLVHGRYRSRNSKGCWPDAASTII